MVKVPVTTPTLALSSPLLPNVTSVFTPASTAATVVMTLPLKRALGSTVMVKSVKLAALMSTGSSPVKVTVLPVSSVSVPAPGEPVP